MTAPPTAKIAAMGTVLDRPWTTETFLGNRVRYPDVVVCAGRLDQSVRTISDAAAVFEVLSDDTATKDRVDKLIEYSDVPSLRCYVLLEQTAVAAALLQRSVGGPWIASADTEGELAVPGLGIRLPLSDVYRGLTFSA